MTNDESINVKIGPKQLLKKFFGYDSFREKQEDIINSICEGRDVFAIMPTGSGKSICYQVPALLLPGISIVVSPLISLMQDQVLSLIDRGIPAAYINSSLTFEEIRDVLDNAQKGKYKILYVSPERLESHDFIKYALSVDISMMAIDEAHCISQWGQDFRPSYLKIISFIKRLNKRPIISAFTATATEDVKNDITILLSLINPYIVKTGFDRENLYFRVERTNKNAFVIDYLRQHNDVSGIIYCNTRKNVENLYEFLTLKGFSVTRYHAGLPDVERKDNQNLFLYDEKQIMIATNAFGMGIDKSNVRFVIHYNMPQCMENYYQEAGRAGRDGEKSECVMLFAERDKRTNEFLINTKDLSEIPEEDRAVIRNRDYERLNAMVRYCRTTDCLRNFILRYFGDNPLSSCGNCSNCNLNYIDKDMTNEAKLVIDCMIEANQRFGITVISKTLLGSKSALVFEKKTNTFATYGAIKTLSENQLRELINQMILNGYIYQTNEEYRVLNLGNYKQIVEGDEKVFVRINQKEKIRNVSRDVIVNDLLLFKLKNLRLTIAREEGKPSYIIFEDKTLREMSKKCPKNKNEMLAISGIGQYKLEKYGERFLKVILQYLEDDIGIKTEDDVMNESILKIANVDNKAYDSNLYEILRKIRYEIAREKKILAFHVFSNQTLEDMCVKMPTTKYDFLDVYGIGKARCEEFGDRFCDAIKLYLKNKD